MDISKGQFKIVFTKNCKKDMDNIYEYISLKLDTPNSAKKLMRKVESTIRRLQEMPETYVIIKKYEELDMEYRRIVINNYVILYTISKEEKIIYITHMYYGGSDYINKI